MDEHGKHILYLLVDEYGAQATIEALAEICRQKYNEQEINNRVAWRKYAEALENIDIGL
jgi:hypothetical protein